MELSSGTELTTLTFEAHLLTKLISTALVAAGRLQAAKATPAQAIIPERMGVAAYESQIILNFDIADGLPLNFVLSQNDARKLANSILASSAI
ncbi:hypothetical protein DSM104635_00619 [Terricaulis silvestris]|uniref:Uncharacterized protein n=2 Tax=Terricaulis silvestris TaxID=2686094 RepID=A0A6I6MKW6_9CAUL|nr:hypothetical protein DSM104635_00619 [Terricaulis silvestris]